MFLDQLKGRFVVKEHSVQVELRKPFSDGRTIKLDVVAHYANTY